MDWKNFAKNILTASAVTGTATTAAVLCAGKVETGNFWSGINAIYHIVEGDDVEQPLQYDSLKSPVGMAVNCTAMGSWAFLHEMMLTNASIKNRWINGLAITVLAYIVDYHVVPKQFTPGFEKRFSGKSIFFCYVVMFLAFALTPRSASATQNP